MRHLLVLGLLGVVGCGSNLPQVKGRVHFADGSPLTVGRVVVDTGEQATGSWASIYPDGTFRMGTKSPTDGMPPGTYRVYIDNAMTAPGIDGRSTLLVHPRFAKAETSALTFTVPDQLDWDITVEPPPAGR